jgi:hypothetical protein
VHAAAVVDPSRRAWLLVGDTHAGKTTTCASLAAAGWDYLADDQVVLRADAAAALCVEGWPRRAHLDTGWRSGDVHGSREPMDLEELFPARWRSSAPLGGLLFPVVRSSEPTTAAPISAAGSLGLLVRQSPWLLADEPNAACVLALLARAASLPALVLSLGRDAYARGDVVVAAMRRQTVV